MPLPPMAQPTIDVPKSLGRQMFIEKFVKKYNWTSGAELGVWQGRTFLHLLKTCPNLKLIGVDLWAPQLDNKGPQTWSKGKQWDHNANEKRVRDGSKKFGNRAIIHKMLTTDAAKLVKDNSLDFVFIDADHSSEGVETDINDWSVKVKDSGMVMGHDINWPTVKIIVEKYFPNYEVGPDNIWFTKK